MSSPIKHNRPSAKASATEVESQPSAEGAKVAQTAGRAEMLPVDSLKTNIVEAAKSVTKGMLNGYWTIGRDVHTLIENADHYGDNVVEELAAEARIPKTLLYDARKIYTRWPTQAALHKVLSMGVAFDSLVKALTISDKDTQEEVIRHIGKNNLTTREARDYIKDVKHSEKGESSGSDSGEEEGEDDGKETDEGSVSKTQKGELTRFAKTYGACLESISTSIGTIASHRATLEGLLKKLPAHKDLYADDEKALTKSFEALHNLNSKMRKSVAGAEELIMKVEDTLQAYTAKSSKSALHLKKKSKAHVDDDTGADSDE